MLESFNLQSNDNIFWVLYWHINRARQMGLSNPEEIYLHDNQTGIYHDLKMGEVIVPVTAGENSNRFTIRFKNETLGNNDFELNNNFGTDRRVEE